jgi:hypothetical protein
MTELPNLIGNSKIVALMELSSDYVYDWKLYHKLALFQPVLEHPGFVLVPRGGWAGLGKIRTIFQKTNTPMKPTTVKKAATLVFNKPSDAIRKVVHGYCLDTTLMLTEGDSKSLSKAITYAPRKVFRYALWGVSRRTKLGRIGGCSLACAVASYEVYRLLFPTNTKVDTFIRGISFTAEQFITDSAVDELGTELCTRYIAEGAARNFLCKIINIKIIND